MQLRSLARLAIDAATAPPNTAGPSRHEPSARIGRWMWFAAPGLLAAGMVLTVYADTGALLYELPRPLFASAGLAILVELAALVMLRRLAWASVVGVVLIALLFATSAVVLLTALLLAAAFVYRQQARIRRRPEQPIASSLATYAVVFLIVALARVITGGAFHPTDLVARTASAAGFDPAAPDIYLVLLDAYPRSDTLAGWDYDNGWFEAELARRGFDVATRSHTSYPATELVMASMLNMQHIDEIARLQGVPYEDVQQTRALAAAVNESTAIAEMERRGYWTMHTGLTEVRGALRDVDQDIDTGEVRLWERQILQRTRLWPWLCEAVVIPQHRSLVRSTFGALERVSATSRDQPTFMLAHVMSPHTPIVFNEVGEPSDFRGESCGAELDIHASIMGVSDADFGAAMSEQVHFVNMSTLSAVDAIIEASPDAVVIVFSDHGARYSTAPTDEWFATFFASRTPGHPELFDDDARPIEIFPKLFDAYFGIDVPIPDDRMFLKVRGNLPLEMDPYPGMDE